MYDLSGPDGARAHGPASLLMVASDRISTYDAVHPTPIPDKGKVLTQLTAFWFKVLKVPNHLITDQVAEMPKMLHRFEDQLRGRAMLVEKLEMLRVECVVRGYLAGSGWADYKRTRSVCGIPLPSGLKESDRLPEAIFTPSTKAESGHDENIPLGEVAKLVGYREVLFNQKNQAVSPMRGRTRALRRARRMPRAISSPAR